jgi:tryptophanyl-tRNA synthetase
VGVFHAGKPFTGTRFHSSGAWLPARGCRRRASSSGARTDSERHVSYDPAGRPAVSSLVLLAALALGSDPDEVAAGIGGGGAAALKKLVITAVNDLLAPVRARRAEYARDPGYVRQVLRDGNQRAGEIATATLAEVRAAMGMTY